jgi:hypothetical protein
MNEDEEIEQEEMALEPEPEPEPEPKKPARARDARLPVTVVETRGRSALVEYVIDGERLRVYVPVEEVAGGEVAEKVLQAGVPHGAPWRELLADVEGGEALANELKRLNVWTNADVERSVRNVQKAIAATGAEIRLGDLRRLAQKHENGG